MNSAPAVTPPKALPVCGGKNRIKLASSINRQSGNGADHRHHHRELTVTINYIFTVRILQIHPELNIKITSCRTLLIISSLYKYVCRGGSFRGPSSSKNGFQKIAWTYSSFRKQRAIHSVRDGSGWAETWPTEGKTSCPYRRRWQKRRMRSFLPQLSLLCKAGSWMQEKHPFSSEKRSRTNTPTWEGFLFWFLKKSELIHFCPRSVSCLKPDTVHCTGYIHCTCVPVLRAQRAPWLSGFVSSCFHSRAAGAQKTLFLSLVTSQVSANQMPFVDCPVRASRAGSSKTDIWSWDQQAQGSAVT